MTPDAQEHLWICHNASSRNARFTPASEIGRIVPVPTAQVTKCAFGAPDLQIHSTKTLPARA
ncbi:hypothetical protein MGN01_19800 [Methylobacterium gnaphalii]|uniref:SMP-30/Gluconolactonase/LRE-like region domain-containing protein n=1 Tax=Methylobacterium gnaphalii TaxID=1010610 RepID=A0A512JJK7_9HYPH|nr:hypothetical protein MGN01_19800 [Methylobacterium gnaphalii]GLS48405.1 hypothetical protein GCM10007885_12490 [Methylobacterium gnaphalii]